MTGQGPLQLTRWDRALCSVSTWAHGRGVCELPQTATTKRLTNSHLLYIHIEDDFAKSFRRNKNFQHSVTDGKEHNKDFTGEKVNLYHLSTLISVGTRSFGFWVFFFNINLSN